MFGIVLQRLAIQFIIDVLFFPVWWYTSGLRRVIVSLWHALQDANLRLAPGLWLKHIFTPMFGQTDIEGRLMSIFMRIVNIIGRSIALYFWVACLALLLCIWIVVPIFFVYMIGNVLFFL